MKSSSLFIVILRNRVYWVTGRDDQRESEHRRSCTRWQILRLHFQFSILYTSVYIYNLCICDQEALFAICKHSQFCGNLIFLNFTFILLHVNQYKNVYEYFFHSFILFIQQIFIGHQIFARSMARDVLSWVKQDYLILKAYCLVKNIQESIKYQNKYKITKMITAMSERYRQSWEV